MLTSRLELWQIWHKRHGTSLRAKSQNKQFASRGGDVEVGGLVGVGARGEFGAGCVAQGFGDGGEEKEEERDGEGEGKEGCHLSWIGLERGCGVCVYFIG